MRIHLVCALFLFCAAIASAEAVQKWRTPEGELYFGDKPPPGSQKLGVVKDKVPVTREVRVDHRRVRRAAPPAVEGAPKGWSGPVSCDHKVTVTPLPPEQRGGVTWISAEVENSSGAPVTNLRVCAKPDLSDQTFCSPQEGRLSLAPKQRTKVDLGSTEMIGPAYHLTTECSVPAA